MEKKTAIHLIELDYHPDMLSSFLSLIDYDVFSVLLSTRREILDKLPKELVGNIQKINVLGEKNISLHSIASENAQLHIFTTLASNYKFWAKHLPKNHVVRIHNIHTWFAPQTHKNYGKSFLEWRKAFTHIFYRRCILQEGKYIEELVNKVLQFSFMSKGNAEYFKNQFPALIEKCGPIFPTAWSEMHALNKAQVQKLNILIPGTPEYKRKDFRAIKTLVNWAKLREEEVSIQFAGKAPAYMYKELEALKAIEDSNLKIIYFKEFVSNDQFDLLLQQADILFFPIKSRTRFKIFEEIYGCSKISGSENDFIRFGKPSIMPDFYPLESDLLVKYNSKNLEQKLSEMVRSYFENFDMWSERNKAHNFNYDIESCKVQHNVYLRKLVAFYGTN